MFSQNSNFTPTTFSGEVIGAGGPSVSVPTLVGDLQNPWLSAQPTAAPYAFHTLPGANSVGMVSNPALSGMNRLQGMDLETAISQLKQYYCNYFYFEYRKRGLDEQFALLHARTYAHQFVEAYYRRASLEQEQRQQQWDAATQQYVAGMMSAGVSQGTSYPQSTAIVLDSSSAQIGNGLSGVAVLPNSRAGQTHGSISGTVDRLYASAMATPATTVGESAIASSSSSEAKPTEVAPITEGMQPSKRPLLQIVLNKSRKSKNTALSSTQNHAAAMHGSLALGTDAVSHATTNPSSTCSMPSLVSPTAAASDRRPAYAAMFAPNMNLDALSNKASLSYAPLAKSHAYDSSDAFTNSAAMNSNVTKVLGKEKKSRFDITASEAALSKAKETARLVESSHMLPGEAIKSGNPTTPSTYGPAPTSEPKKAPHGSSHVTQTSGAHSHLAFTEWVHKLFATSAQINDSVEFKRLLNRYIQRIQAKFRAGLYYDRNWLTAPLPGEEEMRVELTEEWSASSRPPQRLKRSSSRSNSDLSALTDSNSEEASSEATNSSINAFTRPAKNLCSNFSNRGKALKRVAAKQKHTSEDASVSVADGDPFSSAIPVNGKLYNKFLSKAAKRKRMTKATANVMKKVKVDPLSMPALSPAEQSKRQQRELRFGTVSPSMDTVKEDMELPADNVMPSLALYNWKERLELAKSRLKVIGLCSKLEKSFLRLTGAPDPDLVRPESILRKSLVAIQEKYNETKNWHYIEEQFRSIRQDLAVQGIKNEFTIRVYETNARLALSNHDLGQFNQCQTQLRELYRTVDAPAATANKVEFLCYRLIYMALQNMKADLLRVIGEISVTEKSLSTIVFAINVRKSLAEGNWRRYFRLAKGGPCQTKDLCDIFEGRMRMLALLAMTKSSIVLNPQKIRTELFFSSLNECLEFLRFQKTVWTDDNMVDSRLSAPAYAASDLLKSRKIKAMG